VGTKVYTKPEIEKAARAALRKGTTLADAIREIEAKANRPAASYVAAVYWKAAGDAEPIRGRGKALANAVAKRRASGVRWEILAYAVAAGTGRRYSVRETKALAVAGGTDLETSYAGRGTREGARGSRPLAATVAVAKAREAKPEQETPKAKATPAEIANAILANPAARDAILAALAAEAKAQETPKPEPKPAEPKPASVAARTRAAREANAKALRAEAKPAEAKPDAPKPAARRSARRAARKAS